MEPPLRVCSAATILAVKRAGSSCRLLWRAARGEARDPSSGLPGALFPPSAGSGNGGVSLKHSGRGNTNKSRLPPFALISPLPTLPAHHLPRCRCHLCLGTDARSLCCLVAVVVIVVVADVVLLRRTSSLYTDFFPSGFNPYHAASLVALIYGCCVVLWLLWLLCFGCVVFLFLTSSLLILFFSFRFRPQPCYRLCLVTDARSFCCLVVAVVVIVFLLGVAFLVLTSSLSILFFSPLRFRPLPCLSLPVLSLMHGCRVVLLWLLWLLFFWLVLHFLSLPVPCLYCCFSPSGFDPYHATTYVLSLMHGC